MTDQNEPIDQEHPTDPELTLEQERRVTRLLAEARHDQPLPGDVAARLDAALGELSHADLDSIAPTGEARTEPVADLVGHRRRRRNAGRLLLAAVAVIVIGAGVGQVVSRDGSDDSDSSASSDAALDRRAAGGQSGSQAVIPPTASASASQPTDQPTNQPSTGADLTPINLTGKDPDDLAQQLLTQLAGRASGMQAQLAGPADPSAQAERLAEVPGFSCPSPTGTASGAVYGAGELLPAYYAGQPVVLALRPSAAGGDGTTQADVLECGTGAAVTTFTVALP